MSNLKGTNELNIQIGTLIDVAGYTFKVMNFVADDSVYMAKLGANGQTLAPNKGNHGSYTLTEIEKFVAMGSMTIL